MTPPDSAEDRLYRDIELAQFYDLENGWAADFDSCAQLAENARSILDLGCGTGELAARLATDRTVVGVDPAAAMLDLARQRPGGEKVTWRQADARDLQLGRRFDLVLLTGHAFQVFLRDNDQEAVLATIGRHLAPGGRFIFDSRNPAAEAWRGWVPAQSQRSFDHPSLGRIEAWNDAAHDAATGIVTYQTFYRIAATGAVQSAASKIRFTPQKALAALIDSAGMEADQWLGDWQGAPFQATSPEIIPLGRLR